MARGTWWDDFTSKYGFSDGASLEYRDFQARKILVRNINRSRNFKMSELRAVEYDRPGVHNSCLVVVLPNHAGLPDRQLLEMWHKNALKEVSLPEDMDFDIEEYVTDAYDKIEQDRTPTRA